MKIIACVHGAGDEAVSLVASLHRQIRPPEEVIVTVPNTTSGQPFAAFSKVSSILATEQAPLVAVLGAAYAKWQTLTPAERYDTAFLLLHNTELRKDAVDYLRRTYVPGRVVTYHTEDPYQIAGYAVTRLEASGAVLVPSRVFEKLSVDWAEMYRKLLQLPGSKGVGFGWWCASKGVQCGAVGAAVRYARPFESLDIAQVDAAGDHITNFWCAQ